MVDATDASVVSSRLKREVFHAGELRPGGNFFALIDASRPVDAAHLLHLDQVSKRVEARRLVTVKRPDFAHDAALCPRLLTLRASDDHGFPDELLVDATVSCALDRAADVNGAYVAGWLSCRASPRDVASHLARSVVGFDGQRRRVLPWFEPHRLELLTAQAAAERDDGIARMFGPIDQWWFVGLAGDLRSVVVGDDREVGAKGTFALSGPEWEAQHRVPEARRLLVALGHAGVDLPEATAISIDAKMLAAKQHGLLAYEDVAFFCLNAFTLAADWHSHPSARRALSRAAEGHAPLTDLFRQMSDEELDAIGRFHV